MKRNSNRTGYRRVPMNKKMIAVLDQIQGFAADMPASQATVTHAVVTGLPLCSFRGTAWM